MDPALFITQKVIIKPPTSHFLKSNASFGVCLCGVVLNQYVH